MSSPNSVRGALRARPRNRNAVSLAACIAALLLCVPAIGALRIITESPRARIFREVYELLPQCWKAHRLVLVREVTDYEMDLLVGSGAEGSQSEDDSVVDGYYQPGRADEMPTITLRRSIRGAAAELVFAHEYAHYIWDNKLTERQRAEYRRLWSRQERAGRLVTEYAADSVEEGFSEAVSYFLLRQSVLKRRDDQSFRYVQLLIDEGIKRHRQSTANQ